MSVIMFIGITSRMISSTALVSASALADSGAFMGINASISQISGGFASGIAGMIVHQAADGHLENYPMLGYVVAVTMIVAIGLMYNIHRMVKGVWRIDQKPYFCRYNKGRSPYSGKRPL